VYGTAGHGDLGMGMVAGTGSSVTGLAHGGYKAAFQTTPPACG
jgi:hypothetical protein